jgi:hypothetical protein
MYSLKPFGNVSLMSACTKNLTEQDESWVSVCRSEWRYIVIRKSLVIGNASSPGGRVAQLLRDSLW